jgi:hypothetical protein
MLPTSAEGLLTGAWRSSPMSTARCSHPSMSFSHTTTSLISTCSLALPPSFLCLHGRGGAMSARAIGTRGRQTRRRRATVSTARLVSTNGCVGDETTDGSVMPDQARASRLCPTAASMAWPMCANGRVAGEERGHRCQGRG